MQNVRKYMTEILMKNVQNAGLKSRYQRSFLMSVVNVAIGKYVENPVANVGNKNSF